MLNPIYEDEIKSIPEEEKELPKEISESQIEWYLRKINALKAENKSNEDMAAKEIRRIQDWKDHKNEVNNNTIERFSEIVLNYYKVQKEQNKSFKLETPYGKVTDRKARDKWDWSNEKETISSLEDNDETSYIKVSKSLNKVLIKKNAQVTEDGKVVTEDGIVLEGVRVIPQGRDIKLKSLGD